MNRIVFYKTFTVAFVILTLLLQWQLWIGEGSLAHVWQLERELAEHVGELAVLQQRNDRLEAQVRDLKSGVEAYEELARRELGMIRDGETFYLVIDPKRGMNDE